MIEEQKLIEEINQKYSEWFDAAGKESPVLMIKILASMVVQERNKYQYYKQSYQNVRINSTL